MENQKTAASVSSCRHAEHVSEFDLSSESGDENGAAENQLGHSSFAERYWEALLDGNKQMQEASTHDTIARGTKTNTKRITETPVMDKIAGKAMVDFLPSEVARLVLDYLKEIGCIQTYDAFLQECRYLLDSRELVDAGQPYHTVYRYTGPTTLLAILKCYSVLSEKRSCKAPVLDTKVGKTMVEFLPSEVARLVLDYLKEIGCTETFNTFLQECRYLLDIRELEDAGQPYHAVWRYAGPTTLLTILKSYSVLSENSSLRDIYQQHHFQQPPPPQQAMSLCQNAPLMGPSGMSNAMGSPVAPMGPTQGVPNAGPGAAKPRLNQAFQQLLQTLKSPTSPQQQQQVLTILKSNPRLHQATVSAQHQQQQQPQQHMMGMSLAPRKVRGKSQMSGI